MFIWYHKDIDIYILVDLPAAHDPLLLLDSLSGVLECLLHGILTSTNQLVHNFCF